MLGLTRESLPLLLALAGLGLGFLLLVRRHPRLGLGVWLITVGFIPIWFGVSLVAYFQPASAVGLVVLAGLVQRLPRRFGLADLLVVFFFVACLAPVLVGRSTVTTLFVIVTIWGVGYALGRLAPLTIPLPWIHAAVAVVFTAVAAAALVEFALDWHPYEALARPNNLYESWSEIQVRGDRSRSEWAFGHSIALGASLALALPLTMTSPFSDRVRVLMMVTLLGGVAVTFSRIALVSAALAVALTLAVVRSPEVRRIRLPAVGVLVVGAALAVPSLRGVFLEAGEESALSAQYRSRLLDLLPEIEVLGFSRAATRSVTGELRFGQFQSIDSQMIFLGLNYGAVAVVCAIVLLTYASGSLLTGHASPAVVAVVAQIPALLTVALITQYSIWFWFVAGLAVASTSHPYRRGETAKRPSQGVTDEGALVGHIASEHRPG